MKNSMTLFFDATSVNQFFLQDMVKKIMTLLFFAIVFNETMQTFDIVSKQKCIILV